MPEAPAQLPEAPTQLPEAPAQLPEGPAQPTHAEQLATDYPDRVVAQLATALQTLQTRHDELLGRFLGLIEERRTLDQALLAERFKTAGLQRDLGIFQREWELTRARLEKSEAQNDHHKQQALKFQQELHEIRQSRTWQVSQKYWKLTRRVRGG